MVGIGRQKVENYNGYELYGKMLKVATEDTVLGSSRIIV